MPSFKEQLSGMREKEERRKIAEEEYKRGSAERAKEVEIMINKRKEEWKSLISGRNEWAMDIMEKAGVHDLLEVFVEAVLEGKGSIELEDNIHLLGIHSLGGQDNPNDTGKITPTGYYDNFGYILIDKESVMFSEKKYFFGFITRKRGVSNERVLTNFTWFVAGSNHTYASPENVNFPTLKPYLVDLHNVGSQSLDQPEVEAEAGITGWIKDHLPKRENIDICKQVHEATGTRLVEVGERIIDGAGYRWDL